MFQCDIYFDSEYSDDISYFGDHGVVIMFYLYWSVFQCDIYFDSEYNDDISYFGDHGVVIMF